MRNATKPVVIGGTIATGVFSPDDTAAWYDALDARFMPLENLRESISLIRVLHDAVSLCGVADMGAHLPLLSPSPAERHAEIRATALQLLACEEGRRGKAAAVA